MLQVQQGQVGTYTDYATPLEYLITPEIGDCTYDEQRANLKIETVDAYVDDITDRYATGISPINFNIGMAPEISAGGAGVKGPSASAATTFSSLSGNAYEVRTVCIIIVHIYMVCIIHMYVATAEGSA